MTMLTNSLSMRYDYIKSNNHPPPTPGVGALDEQAKSQRLVKQQPDYLDTNQAFASHLIFTSGERSTFNKQAVLSATPICQFMRACAAKTAVRVDDMITLQTVTLQPFLSSSVVAQSFDLSVPALSLLSLYAVLVSSQTFA